MPGITTVGMNNALSQLDGTLYLSAHNGPPAGGTTNEATTRQAVTFGAAYDTLTGRARANSGEVLFTDPGAGTYEAWSEWTAATVGDCLWVVPYDINRTLLAGDDLRASPGAVECIIEPG